MGGCIVHCLTSSGGLMGEAVAGWKTWQQLGSKGFDFNISFDSTAARKLSALLPEDEQTTLKVRSISSTLTAMSAQMLVHAA